MNEIPKLVASTTLTGPLPWNATAIGGGTHLFPEGGVSATLRLTATRTLDSGVVSLTYVPATR